MFQAFDNRGKQPLGPDEILMVQGLIKDYCRERAFKDGEMSAGQALEWAGSCLERVKATAHR